jgi:hypothetical protein
LINNPNTYKDVANYHQLNGVNINHFNTISEEEGKKFEYGNIGQRVLGIKNVTDHAGATTLIFILKRHLQKYYKTKTVELDEHDFLYFNDHDLDSISSNDLAGYINKNSKAEVILVDLNNNPDNLCTDVIYLIEPGLIKLNKLIRKDNKIFGELKDKKIVLNRSVLNEKDVQDFERESGSKVFFNIPSLDDKLDEHQIINEFLINLGFSRFTDNNGQSKGLFNIF